MIIVQAIRRKLQCIVARRCMLELILSQFPALAHHVPLSYC